MLRDFNKGPQAGAKSQYTFIKNGSNDLIKFRKRQKKINKHIHTKTKQGKVYHFDSNNNLKHIYNCNQSKFDSIIIRFFYHLCMSSAA
jgi:hypothetical protein